MFSIVGKKKCVHVLKTLHNYCIYVDMIDKRAYDDANEALESYDAALSRRNELLKRNQAIAERTQKVS